MRCVTLCLRLFMMGVITALSPSIHSNHTQCNVYESINCYYDYIRLTIDNAHRSSHWKLEANESNDHKVVVTLFRGCTQIGRAIN